MPVVYALDDSRRKLMKAVSIMRKWSGHENVCLSKVQMFVALSFGSTQRVAVYDTKLSNADWPLEWHTAASVS